MVFYTAVNKSWLVKQGVLEDTASRCFTTDRFVIDDWIIVAKSYGEVINDVIRLGWPITDQYFLKLTVSDDEALNKAIEGFNSKGGNIKSVILDSFEIKLGEINK